MIRVYIALALITLLFSSCTKPDDIVTRGQIEPTNPEGFTIDTVWNNDTIIPF